MNMKRKQNWCGTVAQFPIRKRANGEVIYMTLRVDTTMTLLVARAEDGKLIGRAGVMRPQDFDFDALLRFAVHSPTIMVR